ncbi:hypothetical protein Pst134EA_005275 [Puccinia striiformis f. sp. tritici]|uniref:hypothetical protein n=1 Tax=Puccinia striiformis f. sp. tritici TaxID=168172 RepID=UPI0020088465|nr:hypothetical protein Pst134EA_005275 [Puccinia striiformis f. sp. tritici]KAH9471374.1 hypothetical protein Pst134EA_005275 [Puccinia striiformis f. sp. tritici]
MMGATKCHLDLKGYLEVQRISEVMILAPIIDHMPMPIHMHMHIPSMELTPIPSSLIPEDFNIQSTSPLPSPSPVQSRHKKIRKNYRKIILGDDLELVFFLVYYFLLLTFLSGLSLNLDFC